MSVSGMVVTLAADEASAESAIEAMRGHPRIEIGIRIDKRLAITGDTESCDDDRALMEWIEALPGVAHVAVVFVHVEPQPASGGLER